MADEDVVQRWQRLAAATQAVRPRPGFTDRVMQAIANEEASRSSTGDGWLGGVVHGGRVALAMAALVAGVGVILAMQSQQVFDTEAAVAFGTVEVGW